jgi:hypothetical protein
MAGMGYGYGSECHLLRWMGRHRSAFDEAVRQAMGKSSNAVNWLDFNFAGSDWPDAELKGLDFISDAATQADWSTWWPKGRGIHNWDAVGWWGDPAQKELVLVEAKAHVGEIRSECKAKPAGGRGVIEQSLKETAAIVGVTDIKPWMEDHYQLANRLAIVHFLRKCGYNPHLILIYFVGDIRNTSRICPQTPHAWAVELYKQKIEMGLTSTHALSPFVHELFLHVSEKSAWLHPNSSSFIALF